MLLYMFLYDESYISMYLVGLSLGILISCMNRSKDGISFMVMNWWMS